MNSSEGMGRPSGRIFLMVGLLVAVLCVLFLLRTPLFTNEALLSPDAPQISFAAEKGDFSRYFSGTWGPHLLGYAVIPFFPSADYIVAWLLSPELAHPLRYALNILFVFCSTVFLLRSLRRSWMACVLGGLAMCLSGHYFTLIAAGHLSKFRMVPYAVLLFGFIARAVDSGKLIHFLLAGAAGAAGLSEHEDVMFMFILLSVAYGIFKLIRAMPATGRLPYMLKFSGKSALAAALCVGMILPKIYSTFWVTIPVRDMLGGPESSEEKWIFATNWSLPPGESVEFLFPCIFGTETSDPSAPYWGALGRPADWKPNQRMMANYRQHTVYLGVIQLVFAFLAFLSLFFVRTPEVAKDKSKGSATGDGAPANDRAEIVFWCAAWIVCVLMAFGRYGPVYGLFYSLPVASSIRCPVKFMHLVELCTAVLFAFGADFFLTAIKRMAEQVKDAVRNRLLVGMAAACAVLGVVSLIAAMVVVSDSSGVVRSISDAGLAKFSGILVDNMAASFIHTSALFLICMLFFILARRYGGNPGTAKYLGLGLLFVLAVDLVLVDKRFVRTEDQRSYIAMNPVIETLRAAQPARVFFPFATQDGLSRIWQAHTLNYYGIGSLDLSQVAGYYDTKRFFTALQSLPERSWQLTNTRFMVIPAQANSALSGFPSLRILKGFSLMPRGNSAFDIVESDPKQSTHLLIENTNVLDRAMVFYSWEKKTGDDVLNRIADKSWNPMQSVIVTNLPANSTGIPAERAQVLKYTPEVITVSVKAKADGIVVLNDRYAPEWHVSVDGKDQELLACNYLMRGVKVSAGEHIVEFKFLSPYRNAVMVRFAAMGVLGLLAVCYVVIVAFRRRPGAG